MTKPGYTGLKRIVMAAGYSLQGFRADGIKVDYVGQDPSAPSGVALIIVMVMVMILTI